jgi:hypothetical protein
VRFYTIQAREMEKELVREEKQLEIVEKATLIEEM